MKHEVIESEALVTQSNQLIEGSYDINLSEIRLLWLALTKVDSKLPQPAREYTLTAQEYSDMYNLDINNCYKQLDKISQTLGSKPIITFEYNEKKNRIDKVSRYWFSKISYGLTGEPELVLKFSEDVSAYLFELKSEFTQMNILSMAKLDSSFSYRLFSWLSKYKNLDRYKSRQGIVKTDPLPIAWMKERAGLMDRYNEYKHFKSRVLEPAISSINRTTDYRVSYSEVKTGRTVTHLIFKYIDKSSSADLGLKPTVPKLPRKPGKNSPSEKIILWAEQCVSLLVSFENELISYSAKSKLPKPLTRKLLDMYVILDDEVNINKIKKILDGK